MAKLWPKALELSLAEGNHVPCRALESPLWNIQRDISADLAPKVSSHQGTAWKGAVYEECGGSFPGAGLGRAGPYLLT